MDIEKKYKRRRFIKGALNLIIMAMYMGMVQKNLIYKWIYIVVGAIILTVVEKVINNVLKIDELRYEVNKNKKG